MKNILLSVLIMTLTSCSSNWEYKVVSVKGNVDETKDKFGEKKFEVTDEALNLFGKEGWELVSVYENTETVHPNFGNDSYVTGLQPNVRTSEVNLVFKRRK